MPAINSRFFFAMVACDVHDDTDEELFALESAMPSEKKEEQFGWLSEVKSQSLLASLLQ